MIDWSKVFAEALPYGSFLDRYAGPGQRSRWDAMHGRFALSGEQRTLLEGFARRMPVLCLCGAWCGDCINQCPVFDHFARATDRDRPPLPGSRHQARGARGAVDQRRPPRAGAGLPERGRIRGLAVRRADAVDLPPDGVRAARPVLPDGLRPAGRRGGSPPSPPTGSPSSNAPSSSSASRPGCGRCMGIESRGASRWPRRGQHATMDVVYPASAFPARGS